MVNTYLAIDTEISGSDWLSGKCSILEVATLAFPEPESAGLGEDEMVERYVVRGEPHHLILKPYGSGFDADSMKILRPVEFYEKEGIGRDEAGKRLAAEIRMLRGEYGRITPLSNWNGDVEVLNYLLAYVGESPYGLLGTHNMFHLKSYLEGKGIDKNELRRVTKHTHSADDDCREIAEIAIRGILRRK